VSTTDDPGSSSGFPGSFPGSFPPSGVLPHPERRLASPRAASCLTPSGVVAHLNRQNGYVSPRKHRRAEDPKNEREERPSSETVEEHPDGVFRVRRITGSTSTKAYRCPGCDQEIRPATPHVVAWPDDGLDYRRHWHTVCWEKRDQRAPRVKRTRDAPRY
jgi:hypothetical protein